MTFKNLVTNITVQGNVRISEWEDDEELYVYEFTYVDNLLSLVSTEELRYLLKKHVKFMFTPGDGYLHIELVDSLA